jgi:hypothetical protein
MSHLNFKQSLSYLKLLLIDIYNCCLKTYLWGVIVKLINIRSLVFFLGFLVCGYLLPAAKPSKKMDDDIEIELKEILPARKHVAEPAESTESKREMPVQSPVELVKDKGKQPELEILKTPTTPDEFALYDAITDKNEDEVERLLKKGTNPNISCCFFGHTYTEHEKSITGDPPHRREGYKAFYTPLYKPAEKGYNIVGHSDLVPLVTKHSCLNNKGILKLMLAHGANPDLKNNEGLTALHVLARANSKSQIFGLSPDDSVDPDKLHMDIIKKILALCSVDPRIKDKKEGRAIDFAKKEKIQKIFRSAIKRWDEYPKIETLLYKYLSTSNDVVGLVMDYIKGDGTNVDDESMCVIS